MPILQSGDNIRETYEVERLLGEGAFAEVYRVKHRFMGRQAMKVFKASGATAADIEHDLSEAILLSTIRHPNIIEVYDANVLETAVGRFGYFTMMYMPGGTLELFWRSHGAELMPVETAVEIIRQSCRGLAVAHSSSPPIIHRDIKPQNILIQHGAEGVRARVSDFGLAKAVNPLTLEATARGTYEFKPPESQRNIDSRAADIWALGTTLYLLLTDELPFPMLNQNHLDEGRFKRPLRPPSIYNARVDPGLESIIFRTLATTPGDRYVDASELLRDLERWEMPSSTGTAWASKSVAGSKTAIADLSPHDLKQEADQALREALRVADDPTKLPYAADLLEEAITKDPTLQNRYGPHLKLWRQGIMPVSTRALSGRAKSPPGSRSRN